MNENNMPTGWQNLEAAEAKLMELFRGMVEHNGLSQLRVDVKPLKKGRKNVVLSSGKDFHFVLKPAGNPTGVSYDCPANREKPIQAPVEDNPGK